MGAGKTTMAQRAGRLLGLEVADTDALIEAEAGRSIPTLFAELGEAGFRELEERVTLAALERGGAVALGGGAVESERIRAALREHVTVWCRIDEELAWARCAGTDRPLARNREGFRRRFSAREPLYEDVARATVPAEDAPDDALAWVGALRGAPEVSLIWARAASGEYAAAIGPGATGLPGVDGVPSPGSRTFAVADREALAAVGELLPAGIEAGALEIEGGEEAKTLAAAERVLSELARAGVRRDDALLAFGGGVIGDLAGFCAAVYQRGIPVVQVPTTLVAQVDSAYGGKTGVDLPEAKNYVGAYHQPAGVLVDPEVLATLPPEEFAAGFAEVVKTALIAGGHLWDRVGAGAPVDDRVILDCARTKLAVVAEDERDGGRRQVLNLGHTIGHAIETVTGYARLRHGEAVGLGLLAALRLSEAADLRDHVQGLLDQAGLPVTIADLDPDEVVAATRRDKKRVGEEVPFVVCEAPGDVRHGAQIAPGEVRAAVAEIAG